MKKNEMIVRNEISGAYPKKNRIKHLKCEIRICTPIRIRT